MPRKPAPRPGDIERRVVEILRERVPNIQAAADGIGISRSQLSECLSGKKPFRFSAFLRLCDYLGIDAARLVAQAEDEAEPDAGSRG